WTNSDKSSNVAVLKVDGVDLKLGLNWGDSSHISPGSLALTIGNQAGFRNSVCLGLISGMGRAGRSAGRRYNNLIQFQRPVSGAGSGGPLLNVRGEVIGMIVAAPADPAARMRLGMLSMRYSPVALRGQLGQNGEEAKSGDEESQDEQASFAVIGGIS